MVRSRAGGVVVVSTNSKQSALYKQCHNILIKKTH